MEKLAAHFHDTYGQALANILVALEEVRTCTRCGYHFATAQLVGMAMLSCK